MVLALINGLMGGNILASGKIIKCMEKVNLDGQMVENMKVIIIMIKKKDTGFSNGKYID